MQPRERVQQLLLGVRHDPPQVVLLRASRTSTRRRRRSAARSGSRRRWRAPGTRPPRRSRVSASSTQNSKPVCTSGSKARGRGRAGPAGAGRRRPGAPAGDGRAGLGGQRALQRVGEVAADVAGGGVVLQAEQDRPVVAAQRGPGHRQHGRQRHGRHALGQRVLQRQRRRSRPAPVRAARPSRTRRAGPRRGGGPARSRRARPPARGRPCTGGRSRRGRARGPRRPGFPRRCLRLDGLRLGGRFLAMVRSLPLRCRFGREPSARCGGGSGRRAGRRASRRERPAAGGEIGVRSGGPPGRDPAPRVARRGRRLRSVQVVERLGEVQRQVRGTPLGRPMPVRSESSWRRAGRGPRAPPRR